MSVQNGSSREVARPPRSIKASPEASQRRMPMKATQPGASRRPGISGPGRRNRPSGASLAAIKTMDDDGCRLGRSEPMRFRRQPGSHGSGIRDHCRHGPRPPRNTKVLRGTKSGAGNEVGTATPSVPQPTTSPLTQALTLGSYDQMTFLMIEGGGSPQGSHTG